MENDAITGDMLKGHVAALVLAIIGEHKRHGYEIMKVLSERSQNALSLGQGTIYPLLYSLEEQGLIRSKEQLVDGRRRRVYSLTSTGRKSLHARRQTWLDFQAAINSIFNPVTLKGDCHAGI